LADIDTPTDLPAETTTELRG